MLPAVPVFLSATGLYDVDYHVSVACRDACVYTLKTGGRTPKYKIPLGSQPCGLQRMDKNVYVGCMDNTLASFTMKVREGGGEREGGGREEAGVCFGIIY